MGTRSSDSGAAVHNRGVTGKKAVCGFAIVTADLATTGDILKIMELPPEAIITSIKVVNDDLDSGGPTHVFDIGLYKDVRNAGPLDDLVDADMELIDVDRFVDGSDAFQAATLVPTEILNGITAELLFKTVRELAGDEVGATPFKYIMGLITTVNATTAAAGDVTFIVEYVGV